MQSSSSEASEGYKKQALDRPDIQYSVKCVMNEVAAPTEQSMNRLRRIVRYLIRHPVLKWRFPRQPMVKYVDAYGDSDWAGEHGEVHKRRSTTCVVERIGAHVVETVSVTQHTISLSSAEAELYASNRAAAGGLQTKHFMLESGYAVQLRVWSDSSASRGIIRRTGTGTVKHIELRWLWVQEALRERRFLLKTVKTDDNPSDVGTKYLSEARLALLLDILGMLRSKQESVCAVAMLGCFPVVRGQGEDDDDGVSSLWSASFWA